VQLYHRPASSHVSCAIDQDPEAHRILAEALRSGAIAQGEFIAARSAQIAILHAWCILSAILLLETRRGLNVSACSISSPTRRECGKNLANMFLLDTANGI